MSLPHALLTKEVSLDPLSKSKKKERIISIIDPEPSNCLVIVALACLAIYQYQKKIIVKT
jgi:hypothetical protein